MIRNVVELRGLSWTTLLQLQPMRLFYIYVVQLLEPYLVVYHEWALQQVFYPELDLQHAAEQGEGIQNILQQLSCSLEKIYFFRSFVRSSVRSFFFHSFLFNVFLSQHFYLRTYSRKTIFKRWKPIFLSNLDNWKAFQIDKLKWDRFLNILVKIKA